MAPLKCWQESRRFNRGGGNINRDGFYTRPSGSLNRLKIGAVDHIFGSAVYLFVPGLTAVWATYHCGSVGYRVRKHRLMRGLEGVSAGRRLPEWTSAVRCMRRAISNEVDVPESFYPLWGIGGLEGVT